MSEARNSTVYIFPSIINVLLAVPFLKSSRGPEKKHNSRKGVMGICKSGEWEGYRKKGNKWVQNRGGGGGGGGGGGLGYPAFAGGGVLNMLRSPSTLLMERP